MKENNKETKFNNNTVCISSFSIYWKQRAWIRRCQSTWKTHNVE